MKFTPEQELAISLRKTSVSLSAGAGCGKTFVLTERFLSHLAPRASGGRAELELGSLVAITFTDRAAREMRDRIRRTTEARLREATDEPTARYWSQLKQQLEMARISTIHSFCSSLLRSHAVEARIDPRFTVLEPAQAATLESELIDDELRRRLAEHDADLIGLVVQFGLARLREMIRRLLESRHEIDFDRWRRKSAEELAADWAGFHRDVFVPRLLLGQMQDRRIRHAVDLLREHEPNHEVMAYRRGILLDGFAALAETEQPLKLVEELHEHARVQGASGKNVWKHPDVAEAVKNALTDLRGLLKKMLVDLGYDSSEALPAAEAGLKLLHYVARVVERYEQRKQEAALLDFDDLLARACRLLTAPEHESLRAQVASGVGMLLVDEFQDTDPLQVRLIEALCGEGLTDGRLFFVGDHKQSIYRFRGADPEVFRRLQARLRPEGRLPLTLNFRSQPAILNFVNALFADHLGPRYEPLQASRPQATNEPAVEFLWAPPADAKEPVAERRAREADWIARRLRELFDSQEPIVCDSEGDQAICRAARPGDVVLLFRAMSDVEHYEAALREHGIDYYVVGGHAFYGQQEVFDVLNLLRALASSADGISLAGVLRSPFFSLADETLFWLAQHPAGLAGGLFDADPPAQLDGQQRQRVEFAARTLSALRELKDRLPVARLLQEALDRTGYDAALVAEYLGDRKLANLRKLVDQARDFDQSGLFTLQDFIVQLDEFVSRQPKEAPAATQAAESQVVRLMTIHQSKGLEFPVVVVADVSRQPRRQPSGVEFDARLGPLVQPRDADSASRPTTGYTMYEKLEQLEEDAETRRLLYVATTRAADYLILSGSHDPAGAPSGPWLTDLLAERFNLFTGELLRPLPEGCAAPRVRVTTKAPKRRAAKAARTRSPDWERVLEEALQNAGSSRSLQMPMLRPIEVDESSRRQYSFSRLTGQLAPTSQLESIETDEHAPPHVSPLDRLGLGTLVHAVLAEIALDLSAKVDVSELVRRHASRHAIDPAGREFELAVRMIADFRDHEIIGRLTSAKRRYAELEFLLAWPPGKPAGEGPYLHGYIDCLYQDEAGRWHLLDYKTNEVGESQVEAAAAPYALQMLVYSLAVEQVVGEPPASCSLYFLRPGVLLPVALAAEERERLIGLVDSILSGQNGVVLDRSRRG